MIDLVSRSNELNHKAKLLIETFPFKQLSEKHFGNLTFVGAYVLNLMMDADIDSNILMKPLDKPKIMAFANDLAEIKECRKIVLYNRLYENNPHFIINVERFMFEDESWILTFFIQEADFQEALPQTTAIKAKLTPANRKVILMLKEWRINNNLKADIPSPFVYEAVLDKGICDIETFKEFLLTIEI